MRNGRCLMHGGGTPETNQNAVTHGIYRKHYTPEEIVELASLKRGSIDDELDLTRLRLSRALAAEQTAQNQPELDSVTENDGGGAAVPSETRIRKVRDYAGIIDRLTSRIESLEKTRFALGITDATEEMNADGLTRGKPDEDGPPNPVR